MAKLLRSILSWLVLVLQVPSVGLKPKAGLIHHAQSLLDHFLEFSPDRHHLSHRLHSRTHFTVHRRKLLQIPSRNLHHAVVQARLETSSGGLRHLVPQRHQTVPQGQLRGHVGKRISGGFGSQGRRSRQPSVDLNDTKLVRFGINTVLDVALPDHTDVSNHINCALSQGEILSIRQCLRRRHNDGIPSVNPHGVKILHVANGDTVVKRISHNLILQFLPALQRSVNDHLRRVGEGLHGQLVQLVIVVSES
mmetsp:Transcript_75052/g.200264  ORF Transcript_75052/g.200264 Transcript_75052/m.200264 type:complete len:250 (+) Transcript_75052:2635-3384(+)